MSALARRWLNLTNWQGVLTSPGRRPRCQNRGRERTAAVLGTWTQTVRGQGRAEAVFHPSVYFKAYPTQDVMGLVFGITQGQVSEWVRQLTAAAGQLIRLHRSTRQARDLTQLLREHPELRELIIDGTERRLRRPQHRWARRNRNASHWRYRRFNGLLASRRISVEDTLASVKRLRILRDEFRNRRPGMVDEVMGIGCTLPQHFFGHQLSRVGETEFKP